ncbi:MAG TPA: hypothetical protein VJO13_00820 [Ktedonobacterales bacterium]|nr:hypothetical protein [Ktedonobacterales bacterium]
MLAFRWRTFFILGLAFLSTLGIGTAVLAATSRPQPMPGAVEPNWLLEWEAPAASAALSPRQALIAGVRARHLTDNSLHAPAHVTVVMDGLTFAQAVVQLDPDGQFGGLVTVTRQQSGAPWAEEQGSLSYITHAPPCLKIYQAPAKYAFLGDICSGMGTMRSPTESYVTWTASNGRQFFAYRVSVSAQRPAAGALGLKIGPNTGWMIQDGVITSVVVPVTQDETFALVAIGTGSAKQVEDTGTQFLERIQLLDAGPLPAPNHS